MKITSTAFENNGKMPEKFTADGENINPELIISDIPEKTKSLMLIVEDPDAQKVVGYTFIHWVAFDITPNFPRLIIPENSIPGRQAKNSFGKISYGGPSPPKGTGVHHYHFKIYALERTTDLEEGSSLEDVRGKIKHNILEETELIGTYSRD